METGGREKRVSREKRNDHRGPPILWSVGLVSPGLCLGLAVRETLKSPPQELCCAQVGRSDLAVAGEGRESVLSRPPSVTWQ